MRDLNVRTNLIAVGDKPAKLAKLTVTDNGTYTPTYPIEGYDEVKVEIPEPPPVILEDLNVTENGTYDPADYMADGFSEVTVNVPQSSGTDDSNINYYMSGSNFGSGCYITNGHFLHFTTSGYPNYQITNSSGQRLYYDLSDFEMCLTIKCNTFTVSRDQRLCCNGYDDAYSPMLLLASDGKIWTGISTNSGNNLNTTCTLAADGTRATKLTEGWCKIKIGFKNRVYTLTFIDKDGNIETTSTDASNNPYSNTSYGYGFQLGDRSSSNSCPDVVIDLSKSYYKQGNTYVWGHAQ